MIFAGDFEQMRVTGTYRKTSNISRTLVGNKIVDNSDVVEQLLQLHLHYQLNTWLQ